MPNQVKPPYFVPQSEVVLVTSSVGTASNRRAEPAGIYLESPAGAA